MKKHNDNPPRRQTVNNCAHEMLQSLIAAEDILLTTYPEHLRAPISELLQAGKLRLAIAMCCSLHGHEHTRHIIEQVMRDFAAPNHTEPTP